MASKNKDTLTEAQAADQLGIEVSDSAGDTVVDMDKLKEVDYEHC